MQFHNHYVYTKAVQLCQEGKLVWPMLMVTSW